MGVDRSDYVIYGFKLPDGYLESKGINIWEDEKYLPFIEEWEREKYSIINDQMCGEYCVFGLRVAYANRSGFDFIELPPEGWLLQTEQVKTKFNEVFGISAEELGEPNVLLFTHYL